MIPSWVAKYIGIPFLSLGRSAAGCDCYGLVWMVMAEQYGRNLPRYSGDYENALDHDEIGALIDRERPLLAGARLPAPEIGSVAVVRISGKHCHLGVYVGDGRILHSRDKKNGSLLERVDSPFLAGKIEGYYHVG